MKVLADYHHGNLYHSLHVLFEKRLGYELYRPIGRDWFENRYWKVAEPYNNAEDTIQQYLGIDDRIWDAYSNLNGGNSFENEIYHIFDHENSFKHKAITFEQFKKMEFDYIVATHPLHENWGDLLRFQPNARYIAQLGNEGQVTQATNVLCSTNYQPLAHQNLIRYHQEFDLTDYYYVEPTNHKKITSLVVGLPEREYFIAYKNALPEYDFKAYGMGSLDGNLTGVKEISEEMRNSAFGWHIKPYDGYGHVIHKWYAVGRPVITKGSYYEGKIAGQLLIDGVTCIDLDKHSYDENIQLIKFWSQPENHKTMCENAYKRFKEVVDFGREAEEIRTWLTNLP